MRITTEPPLSELEQVVIAISAFERHLDSISIDPASVGKIAQLWSEHAGWQEYWPVEGLAEDARSIRADWAQVGEDLRRAMASMVDELQLENAVG